MPRMRWQAGVLFGIAVLLVIGMWFRASRTIEALATADGARGPDAAAILARAGEVCRVVDPQADGLTLSVQQNQVADPFPTRQVVATDRDGRDVLSASWSVHTGELFVVCRYTRPPDAEGMPVLSRADATRAAWHWLEALGVSGYASGWHLAKPGVHPLRTWAFSWRAPGRAAFVTVDDRTGGLVMLVCRPVPSGEALQAGA